MDKIVPTIVFVEYKTIKIQFNVFYKRGNYYWSGDDASKMSDPKYFGDTQRGIDR